MTAIEEVVDSLFDDAQSVGGVQYIYTLLRVSGPNLRQKDQLIELKADLTKEPSIGGKELFAKYCSWIAFEEPVELLANLLNCTKGRLYSVAPFNHLNTGEFPNIHFADHNEKVLDIPQMASRAGRPELAQAISKAYRSDLLNACSENDPPASLKVEGLLQDFSSLWIPLLKRYFAERLKYRNWPRFHKVSPFIVIELLTNDEYGLYGLRMHYPAGANSEFERHPEAHRGKNFLVNPHITPWVGLIDNMQKDWIIEGKKLHELGIPGRYNSLGEWKPIVAPLAVSALSEQARSLSDDPDVQGTLFYILSTGFLAVEFVVLANIDLPHESVSFGEELHLWKCPPVHESPHYNSNLRIYDGWLELQDSDPDQLKHSIAIIGVTLNRLAFAYDATLNWRVKYRLSLNQYPLWTPTEADTELTNSLLKDFPQSEDAFVLDAAIDWYTRGKSSQNVFAAFLCYYVAVESVARAIADGDAEFGIGFQKETPSVRRSARLSCIHSLHDAIYATNPQKFVTDAYFNCVVGIKEQVRGVTQLVFGEDHQFLKLLFDTGTDGHSLTSIRAELAHGGFTLVDRDHERLVRGRLHEIEEISKEFLIRLIFFLKPDQPIPSWSRKFSDSMHFTDPRSTMFLNSEIPIEGKDWRIRAEWCS